MYVWFMLKFRTMSSKPGGNGAAEEAYCFGRDGGGARFAIFRNGELRSLGSWWTVTLRLDENGELIDRRFWHNRMEPGDVRLTGRKLRDALRDWYAFRPVHTGITD